MAKVITFFVETNQRVKKWEVVGEILEQLVSWKFLLKRFSGMVARLVKYAVQLRELFVFLRDLVKLVRDIPIFIL